MRYLARLFFFVVTLLFFSAEQMSAQVPLPQRNTSKDQSAQPQRQVNEQLARSFYNNKEYDKAAELYNQLYSKYNYYHYFSQYIECLLFLENYEEAEKSLKSFIKRDNTTNKWKAQINLAYVYHKNGETEKADKYLKRMIGDLPEDRNVFSQVANTLRSKDFDEYAIILYDRGSAISSMNYKFYMEKALAYQSMMNFEKATENYLLHLETEPDDYEIIKSRLSFMIRYDMDGSVTDVMRMALLKKTQENPEEIMFAELVVWFALQMKDYEIALNQEIALDRRLNDREYDIIYLARISRDNEQYDVAAKAYDYLIKKSKEGAQIMKVAEQVYSAAQQEIDAEVNNSTGLFKDGGKFQYLRKLQDGKNVPKIKRHEFDSDTLQLTPGYRIISQHFYPIYEYPDSGKEFSYDFDASRGRVLYDSPTGRQEVYFNYPDNYISYDHGYMPIGTTKDQESAKKRFYQFLDWADPKNPDVQKVKAEKHDRGGIIRKGMK